MFETLQLRLHLIPSTSFNSNIRNLMGPEEWTTVSRKIRSLHNYTCQFCGWKENRQAKQYTHCHEVWDFDDESKVQSLVGLECVCPTCHAVHHWGKAAIEGRDMVRLLEHACWINKCSPMEFETHIRWSFDQWRERSEHTWLLDEVDASNLIMKSLNG